jgi:hypothetical protein
MQNKVTEHTVVLYELWKYLIQYVNTIMVIVRWLNYSWHTTHFPDIGSVAACKYTEVKSRNTQRLKHR